MERIKMEKNEKRKKDLKKRKPEKEWKKEKQLALEMMKRNNGKERNRIWLQIRKELNEVNKHKK